MNAVVPFAFEGAEVRVITRDDAPWFVLADVCRVLEIAEAHRAASRLDDDEKGRHTMTTPGGPQEMAVINESGLYSLTMTSRKDAARRFKKWVTAEVLPAIRRTGGYMTAAPDETPEQLALRAMQVLQATVERQKAQLAEVAPKAAALDRIATADGSLCLRDAAKALQLRPKDLLGWMQQHQWIYRRAGGDHWIGYQARIQDGDLEHKVTTVSRSDGSERIAEQVRVTPKGLSRLAKAVPGAGLEAMSA